MVLRCRTGHKELRETHTCIGLAQIHATTFFHLTWRSFTTSSLLHTLNSHTTEKSQATSPFLLAQAHDSPSFLGDHGSSRPVCMGLSQGGSVLSPSCCRWLEWWQCRGGTTVTPAHPPPPQAPQGSCLHGRGGQGLLPRLGTRHFTSLLETLGWEAHGAPHPCWDASKYNYRQSGKAAFHSDVAKE